MPYGFDDGLWDQAKREALDLLINRSRNLANPTISYTELVESLTAIRLEAHDPRLSSFLEEIIRAEHAHNRPLITLLVVHAHGDRRPGDGFYEISEELGFDVNDRDLFWIEQFNRIVTYWENN